MEGIPGGQASHYKPGSVFQWSARPIRAKLRAMNTPKVKLLFVVCGVMALGALLASLGAGSHFQFGFVNGDFNFDVKTAFGESEAATVMGLIALVSGLTGVGLALAPGAQKAIGEVSPAGGAGSSGALDWMGMLRRLTKSNKDEWVSGVCGGLGEHTPLPSWVWRFLFLVLLLCYGTGVVLYILLWICLPEPSIDEEEPEETMQPAK